jgi:hypothetical protein
LIPPVQPTSGTFTLRQPASGLAPDPAAAGFANDQWLSSGTSRPLASQGALPAQVFSVSALRKGKLGDRQPLEKAGVYRESPQAARDAGRFLADNQPAFQTALQQLSPELRVPLAGIYAAMAGRPAGQAAFAKLVLGGALTTGPDHAAVLENLAGMATQPLAPGVDRARLLADVVQDLQKPESITQGTRESCECASRQNQMALTTPGEYTRLIAALAAPGGEVVLADGHSVLRRSADWSAPELPESKDTRRSLTGMLFQPAGANLALQHMHGPHYHYNNKTDRNIGPNGKVYVSPDGLHNGLTNPEFAFLCGALAGKPHGYTVRVLHPDAPVSERRRAAADAYRSLAHGHAIQVLTQDYGGHLVTLVPGNDHRIHLYNPVDGVHESLSQATFEQMAILAAITPKEDRPPAPAG